MKNILNLLIAIILLFIVSPNAFAKNQQQTKDVYATIQSGINLNLRQGPGKSYSSLEILPGGSTVTIVNLNTYDQGWICVKSTSGNVGYLSTKYLVGNYVEQFNAQKTIINQKKEHWQESFSTFISCFLNFWGDIFLRISNMGWKGFIVVAILLALAYGIIYCIRSFDRSYKKPWIHYLFYFVTILPTWGFFQILLTYKVSTVYYMTLSDKILLFFVALIPAVLAVHAGWGIRECGMHDGKYLKNNNYYVGQFLQFPVWLLLISGFEYAFLTPLINYPEFTYCGGGFWRFILGLIIIVAIVIAVLFLWLLIIIPIFFKIAGKWPLYIMTLTLWITMADIAYDWTYENFNGFGCFMAIFVGGLILITIIIAALVIIRETRCPMCHNCNGKQTNLTDEGISYSTSRSWRNMDDSKINPRYFNAEVSNARRLVETTTATHNWNTEHTCPNCQYQWNISHSEVVGSSSREIKRRWDERY